MSRAAAQAVEALHRAAQAVRDAPPDELAAVLAECGQRAHATREAERAREVREAVTGRE